MKAFFFSLIISGLITTTAFAQDKPSFSLPELLKIKKIEKTFTGNFDNKAQADTTQNKMLGHQQVRVLRIWKKKYKGEYWMYSGWFYAGDENNPFQEVAYQVVEMLGDTMVMQGYLLPIQLRREGKLREREWRHGDAFDNIDKEDLKRHVQFYIFPQGEGYRMESRPFIVEDFLPNSAFSKVGFRIDRSGKDFTLNNEYHLKNGEKVVLPQGVLYKQKTSSPAAF